VLATKSGFRDAWEVAEFAAETGTHGITLVLREPGQDFDSLPEPILVETLTARLRDQGTEGPQTASARKLYAQGVREFLDREQARRAVPLLAEVASREPGCVTCRTMLGLALLEAGSWAGAIRQLNEIAQPNHAKTREAARLEPLFILGVVESWRRQPQQATGWFLKALEVQPSDPLVLQELGRTLVLQKRWEAAERYLEQAIQQGAGPEARLLRAWALLETGDEEAAETAQAELRTFLAGRRPKDLTSRVRPVFMDLQERLQLKSQGETKSLVNQPLEELSRAVPELKSLESSSNPEGLSQTLERVGQNVEAFFRNFPSTTSHEEIHMERLDRKGKVLASEDRRFNYLYLARVEKAGLGLDEYRTAPEGTGGLTSPEARYFMRTVGFAGAPLVLIPAHQVNCTFRYLGREVIDGRPASVLAFAQLPGKAKALTTFNADGKSSPILMQGIVWVDPESYQVIRMHREVLNPPPQSRLARLTTEIDFTEVQFKDAPGKFWLPHDVTVTVHWKKRFFRNRHHYSDFRLFKVETEEKRRGTTASTPENPT
jgi:Flp pilus assembly protein TadD